MKTALEGEPPSRGPDLAWVLARARRLRLLRVVAIALSAAAVAGVVGTTALSLPGDPASDVVTGQLSPPPHTPPRPRPARSGEVVEDVSERQRAEIFAVRALAATGLLRPFSERSYNFTYEDDTTRTDAGWRIGFSASDCSPATRATGSPWVAEGSPARPPTATG